MKNKHLIVAGRLIKIAESIEDEMESEKLSKLFVRFHAWATKEATNKSPLVASQILKGMNAVGKELGNKLNLTGREAVKVLLKAILKYFTKHATPIPYLQRKYGNDIGGLMWEI